MTPRSRFSERLKLVGIGVTCAMTLSAGMASARPEVLRWTHPNSSLVVSWEAHVGSATGTYTQVIPFSNPPANSGGIRQTSIEVADQGAVFIAIRAIGQNGQRSALSNERVRVGPVGPPPPTAPPAPPTLIQVIPVEP